MAEAHEKADVDESIRQLGLCAADSRAAISVSAVGRLAADDEVLPGSNEPGTIVKKVHLIRHGEGAHNVAQREWRAQPDWDGVSEPYTMVTDPGMRYLDPELTALGVSQARDLQRRTAPLAPEVLVLSPMRRALQTGLLAFEQHLDEGRLLAVATDLCHECGGKHTCDRRSAKADLQASFPAVDFSLLTTEEDPYWGDGLSREPLVQLAGRAAKFVAWLHERPERHIAVSAHSAILLAVMNAGLMVEAPEAKTWLATGEMRTFMISFTEKPSEKQG